MFIHKKTVIFIPYFDSPFCLINYWQNGGFFLKSEIPDTIEKSRRLARMAHAGFAVESSSSEWEYKSDSRLSALIQRIYLKRYGQPIKVEVSHGGNECGTFFKHFPDADSDCTGTQIIGPHTPNESVMVSIIQKEWEMLQLELKGMLQY